MIFSAYIYLLSPLGTTMKKIFLFPFLVLTHLFGKVLWTAPPWLQRLSTLVHHYSKSSLSLLLLVCLACAGYWYVDSLPKPVMVKAEFDDIQITSNYDDAQPSNINIQFEYDFSALNDTQERPEGVPSVARIDLVGKKIPTGIDISPAKKGTWSWIDDRRLRFVPEIDWPAGTEYNISFEPSVFVEEVVHSQKTYTVSTPEMTAHFSGVELYQDPQDISLRRVVATLKFSHPIDKGTLEKKVRMAMSTSNRVTHNNESKKYGLSLTYDKNYREAYIQSEPVTLPNKSSYMNITLLGGVKSILGGEEIHDEVNTKTFIPDVFSFLKASTDVQIIRNEKNEPEQVVMLDFTDNIDKKELMDKLSIYLLPKHGERYGRHYWQGPREINENVLINSVKVPFTLIPIANEYAKRYNLKIDVPENRYLYVKINKGLTSVNKYIHASFYDAVIGSPE